MSMDAILKKVGLFGYITRSLEQSGQEQELHSEPGNLLGPD